MPVYGNILEEHDNYELLSKYPVNYKNTEDVVNLIAKHLGKIFVATYRNKVLNVIDNS